jgi:uncharacterized protein (TIRG00374 family)
VDEAVKVQWRAVFGFAVTGFLLWWVLKDVSFQEVWREVEGANLWLLGLGVAMATVTFFIRALRWKVLLQPIHPGTSLHKRFAAVTIGFMANNLLPARVGEFARAYALARLEPVPVTGAFGSLVVERFLDGLTLLLFVFLAMAAPGFPDGATMAGLPVGAYLTEIIGLLVLLMGALVLLVLFPGPVVAGAEWVFRRLPGQAGRVVVDALEAFLDGLSVFRSPALLVLAVVWSLAMWTWQTAAFWVGMMAFGIHVGFDAAMFVHGIISFAVAVPAAPGFFGTFQWGAILGLGVYGVAEAPTVAYSLGFHLGGFIPVTVIGLFYLWRLGISLKEVEESESRVEEAVEKAHPLESSSPDSVPGEGIGLSPPTNRVS